MAIGSALAGICIVIGENVCGMDPQAEFKNGKVVKSPELERRIKTYLDWYDGNGAIIVQQNVEDGRLGVPDLALKYGAHAIELKWGQGAKDIGGEVKLPSVERALELKSKGYIVHPDPTDPAVVAAFKQGTFKEFERHSRLGMVEEEGFYRASGTSAQQRSQVRHPQDRRIPAPPTWRAQLNFRPRPKSTCSLSMARAAARA